MRTEMPRHIPKSAAVTDGSPAMPAERATARITPLWLSLLKLAWGLGVVATCVAAAHYKLTPGHDGPSPIAWPEASVLLRAQDRIQVVMFAHPRCPCTRASLAELDSVLAEARRQAAVTIVMMKPGDAGPQWLEGDVLENAARIPGVAIVIDVDGAEAARFGAQTSGHVFAYDIAGSLAYSGGITGARGHVGDNAGRRALLAVLTGEAWADAGAPTFGCDIAEPAGGSKR